MVTPRAFVAGATGYTGRAVVAELARRGIATVAHIRPGSEALDRLGPELTGHGAAIDTTPWEREAMVDALRRHAPTMVFALLGTTAARIRSERRAGPTTSSYETVDYGLSVMLLHAASRAATSPRFVYLSAIGAARPVNAYSAVRARVERELEGASIPWTSVRPSWVSGPDREETRVGERAASIATEGIAAVLRVVGAARLSRRIAPIGASELARELVRIALDPAYTCRVVESEELDRSPAGPLR